MLGVASPRQPRDKLRGELHGAEIPPTAFLGMFGDAGLGESLRREEF